MPREIAHWNILELALAGLEAAGHPALADAVESHHQAAYIGAVLHDAPYYLDFGNSPFQAVAEKLHGTGGEDTILPLLDLAREAVSVKDSQQRRFQSAVLFGMLSHCAADAVFHPFVYYFTGNYYDPDPVERMRARTNHRLFEVHLDSWFKKKIARQRHTALLALLRACDASLTELCRFVSPLGGQADTWRRSLRQMALMQAFFSSSVAGALSRLAGLSGSHSWQSIDALFSFRRRVPPPFFDEMHAFINPVSGEGCSTTAKELLAKAVELTVQYAALPAALLAGAEALPRFPGLSLNFGVETAPPGLSHHYFSSAVPLPGLIPRSSRNMTAG